jgi:rubredoxin
MLDAGESAGPTMSDDYLERIARLLPEDAFARYCEIKDAMFWHRQQLWKLQRDLVEIASSHGVPDIDDPTSPTNALIRQALGAIRTEINSIWASTPPEWRCPCCERTKPECARLGAKAQMLGKLVAHHDHIEELMSVVLSDLSKELAIEAASSRDAEHFIRRGWRLLTRFDRIVICEDCNNAEATGKAQVAADEFFTFTPREISSFLRAAPNRPHEVDGAVLAAAYAAATPHYERRVAFIRRLAEHALKGTAWYEPVAFEVLDEQVDRKAQQALRLFGLEHVGAGSVHDIFFPSRKIDIKHAPAWRSKQMPAPRTPTEAEFDFVVRGHPTFGGLPEDWACPCCARSKRVVIRWSQNGKQFMFAVRERNIPDPSASDGTRKIMLCDACNHTFQECHKELRMLLGDDAVPGYPVSLEEIRSIIRPTPHGLHDVHREAAEALVRRLIAKLQTE